MRKAIVIALGVMFALMAGCLGSDPAEHPVIDRESVVPLDVEKGTPENDDHPPILHSELFRDPVPVPYPVNTAGAEDSPFVLPDGNTLYFFFTPDVRIPPEKQVIDDVSGIYVTRRSGGIWGVPERVWLQDPGKLALDGAVAVQGDEMWFASAREGRTGVNMFTARMADGEWTDWKYSGDRLMKEIGIGEVHIRGDDLYFHSDRPGGKGGYDIWMTSRSDNDWSDPVNLEPLNTEDMDGYPFVSSDGNEIWFTRTYLGTPAIYRSVKYNGTWGDPHIVMSQFAGEPTLDDDGNLYFVHHYYKDGEMIEADIYFAERI